MSLKLEITLESFEELSFVSAEIAKALKVFRSISEAAPDFQASLDVVFETILASSDLTPKQRRTLMSSGLITVRDILKVGKKGLMDLEQFGKYRVDCVASILKAKGYIITYNGQVFKKGE